VPLLVGARVVRERRQAAEGVVKAAGVIIRDGVAVGVDNSGQPAVVGPAGHLAVGVLHFAGRGSIDRPAVTRLLADLRAGKVKGVVVWRLDRLGRTARGLLALLDELQALGVGFVSLREGIDLATPAGRLMLVVLAGVSQYETEVRKERQLAGIARAKAEGKKWGGRKPGTRIRLTQEKEALIRQLYAEGKAVAAIARLVGLSPKSVYKALEPARAWPEPPAAACG